MRTDYTIKNFRVFGEEGANVKLAPLTILTGCNSSGKSSIVKSVLLLDSYLKGLKEDKKLKLPLDFDKCRLDFTLYPNNLLGRYHDVINHEAGTEEIELSYGIHSNVLGSDVQVELTFMPEKNDALDNGHLKRIVVKKDNEIFYNSSEEGSWINIDLVKESISDFYILDHYVYEQFLVELHDNLGGDLPSQIYDEKLDQFIKDTGAFDKRRLTDVLQHFRYVSGLYRRYNKKDESFNINVFNKVKQTGCLFDIPVVHALSQLSKEEAIIKLQEIISKESDERKKKILSYIPLSFQDSNANNFEEFYHKKESEWLSHIYVYTTDSSTDTKKIGISYQIQAYIYPKKTSNILEEWSDDVLYNYNYNCDLSEEEVIREVDNKIDRWLKETHPFTLDYSLLLEINNLFGEKEDPQNSISEYVLEFIKNALLEIALPTWSGQMGYVSSSRVEIKRIYDMFNNDDFTRLLKSYFENQLKYKNYLDDKRSWKKRDYIPEFFINKWLDKFGIGKALKLEMDSDGAGLKIRLVKNDGRESLLANEGYGISQLMSILIQIESAIQGAENEEWQELYGLSDFDGFKDLKFRYSEQTIAIEELEIHLHPRYQSLLADMFVDAYQKYNIHFIVETHSEYLIRRLQLLAAKGEVSNKDISVVYVGANGKPYNLDLQKDGKFMRDFGPGFFDEADNSSIELFELNNQ